MESAYYLNDPNGDMLTQINDLRDRAGMPSLNLNELTEEKLDKSGGVSWLLKNMFSGT